MNITDLRLLTILMLSSLTLQGQAILKDSAQLQGFNSLHQESVYIHHNTSLFLTGERMYYAIYCVNTTSNLRSALSKIAYVELVGVNGALVFMHKVRLNSGIGQGDFFIPASVKTGNYKLIGYTNWMKNRTPDYFFKSEINIVNPFQKNQNLIMELAKSVKNDSVVLNEIIDEKSSIEAQDLGVHIRIDSTVYKKRALVRLRLENLIDKRGFGTYSISVRKKDSITKPNSVVIDEFLKKPLDKLHKEATNDSIYLPELRGEIVHGKVVSKVDNSSVSNVKVAMSIPGKNPIVKIAKTNGEGMFYFNLNKITDQSAAIFQILGNQRDTNKIIMEKSHPALLPKLTFNKLEFTNQMTQLLVERSIHNQIENAYLSLKQDTLNSITNTKQFYQKYDYEYNLEDYTRFTTMEEIILEVIDYVWLTKNQNDGRQLHVRGYDNISKGRSAPMVLVDGLLLQNHDDIIDFDALKIKKISLKRDEFRIGQTNYKGIIAFETLDGTFASEYKNKHIAIYKMLRPQRKTKYFKQKYNQSSRKKEDKLPDFRHQLLWFPDYDLNKNSKLIEFYTSDVSGDFEICVEGITNQGKPISLKADFIVE